MNKPLSERITPGKWERAKHGITPGNTSIEVQTETGLPVAIMSYCGSADANAELIAQAPTLLTQRNALLAACREAIKALELGQSGTRILRQAIASAEKDGAL